MIDVDMSETSWIIELPIEKCITLLGDVMTYRKERNVEILESKVISRLVQGVSVNLDKSFEGPKIKP